MTLRKPFCKFVFERAREIVLDFICLKLLRKTKLRSIILLGWRLDLRILEGTLDVHFDNCGQEFQEVVKKVRDDMYVDDLVTGRESISKVKNRNQISSDYSGKRGGLSYIIGIPTKRY